LFENGGIEPKQKVLKPVFGGIPALPANDNLKLRAVA
jgi:hypothetical protein